MAFHVTKISDVIHSRGVVKGSFPYRKGDFHEPFADWFAEPIAPVAVGSSYWSCRDSLRGCLGGVGARAYWNGPWFWSAVTANDSSVQKITLIEARHRVAYMLRKTFDLSGTTAHDVKDARATPRSRYGGWCS